MTHIRTVPAFVLAVLLSGAASRAGEKSAAKDVTYRRAVQERLCYAGRFRFERSDRGQDVYLGRFVERFPSSEGHPNAEDLGEVYVVIRGKEGFQPEVGKTYCLVLTAGSKRGMTIEGFGPDDEATARQMNAVIESPTAFENDATWKKRRALWAQFRKDEGPDQTPLLYAEDTDCRRILFAKGGELNYPLFLYDSAKRKSEQIIHAKVLPGMNRITFDKGYFRVWFNGSIELSVGAGGED